MTEQQHPITPPPELVQRLYGLPQMRAIEAAFQAGADAELKACCEYLFDTHVSAYANALRAARRPKPPSLKELALEEVQMACNTQDISMVNFDTIRKALEQLND